MRSSVAALVIIIAAVFSGLPGWVPIVALVGLLLNLSALRQVTKQLQKYSLPTSPHTPGGDGTS
jgi:uncharacterized membrane protein